MLIEDILIFHFEILSSLAFCIVMQSSKSFVSISIFMYLVLHKAFWWSCSYLESTKNPSYLDVPAHL